MPDFSFAVNGNNAALKYSNNGQPFSASIRVKRLSSEFAITATESQSRTDRAFYPHRRSNGKFQITVDCIGHREYKQLMTWMENYADVLLASRSSLLPAFIFVDVPARNFSRTGILCTGMNDHDNVGSMVFTPTFEFITIEDANDPTIERLSGASISNFPVDQIKSVDSANFYPVTGSISIDGSIYDSPNIDPVTGMPVDDNGFPYDPITGQRFSPITGKPIPHARDTFNSIGTPANTFNPDGTNRFGN